MRNKDYFHLSSEISLFGILFIFGVTLSACNFLDCSITPKITSKDSHCFRKNQAKILMESQKSGKTNLQSVCKNVISSDYRTR